MQRLLRLADPDSKRNVQQSLLCRDVVTQILGEDTHERKPGLRDSQKAAPDPTTWQILAIVALSAWKSYKWLYIINLLVSGLVVIFELAEPFVLKTLLDSLTDKSSTLQSNSPLLVALIVGYGVSQVKSVVLSSAFTRITYYIAVKVEDSWRYCTLYWSYMLPMSWHDKHDSGKIGHRIDRGGGSLFCLVWYLFGDGFLFVIVKLVSVLISVAVTAPPGLLVAFFLPIPIYGWAEYKFAAKASSGYDKLNTHMDDSDKILQDGLANARTVKAFGKEFAETEQYARVWDQYHKEDFNVELQQILRDFVQETIKSGSEVALLLLCFLRYDGQLTAGEISMLLSLQTMLFSPVSSFNETLGHLHRWVRKVRPLIEIVRTTDPLADSKTAVDLPTLTASIKIDNVSFAYSAKTTALRKVSLEIPRGSTTALVGRSGAGKSTMISMLQRFHDPSEGSILWDGVDLRSATRTSLAKQISLVPQDVALFNRSIYDNITYGVPGATKEAVEAAAEQAFAHEFISQLPDGYNSVIGERGCMLSGGQKQRVAIARALLTKPSLLLIDEGSSHLDTESERKIQMALNDIGTSCTKVIIAHRLSTVLSADQIAVVDQGTIISVGTHAELLQKCDLYKRLHEMQFSDEETSAGTKPEESDEESSKSSSDDDSG